MGEVEYLSFICVFFGFFSLSLVLSDFVFDVEFGKFDWFDLIFNDFQKDVICFVLVLWEIVLIYGLLGVNLILFI